MPIWCFVMCTIINICRMVLLTCEAAVCVIVYYTACSLNFCYLLLSMITYNVLSVIIIIALLISMVRVLPS